MARVDYKQLQTLAGEAVEYLGIRRGVSKKKRIADGNDESTYIHRTVRQLHFDLPRELTDRKKKVDGLVERYAKKAPAPKPSTVLVEKKSSDDDSFFKKMGFRKMVETEIYTAEQVQAWARKALAINAAVAEMEKEKKTAQNMRNRNEQLKMDMRERAQDSSDKIYRMEQTLQEKSAVITELSHREGDLETYLQNRGIEAPYDDKGTLISLPQELFDDFSLLRQ